MRINPVTRTRLALAVALAATLTLAAPAAASAFSWQEDGDAGSLLADAQVPTGSGALDEITGAISTTQPNADEDLYKVCLTGESFAANTTTTANSTTSQDPMLDLFDADGMLVAADDDDGPEKESEIVLISPAAGPYYLAIVAFANRPEDALGSSMTSPGDGPFVNWSEGGQYSFGYTIALSGVQPCPPPGDGTDPTVTITTPPDDATYLLGESVAADYQCADEGGSGLADCAGTVADGDPIDTASVGPKQFTVTARDGAGNETIVTHDYNVAYAFGGFLAPIDDGAYNVLKAGQAVPVKFSLGGDQGLDVLLAAPTSRPVDCEGDGEYDPVEQTATAGASGLTYDPATGIYTYTWKTDKAWTGTCRQLTVTLADGTSHTALFSLTR